jgi:hypothetical protein
MAEGSTVAVMNVLNAGPRMLRTTTTAEKTCGGRRNAAQEPGCTAETYRPVGCYVNARARLARQRKIPRNQFATSRMTGESTIDSHFAGSLP